ncbi:hypothetical protein ACWGH2_41850 [Streptomyces sp. NPDC054871]
MTTAVDVDYRTPFLALRAAVRAVKESPEPLTIADLSSAVLALPGGPSDAVQDSSQYVMLLRALEQARESQIFPRIAHMVTTVEDLARSMPSWTPRPYASEAAADVVQLLALCHEWQPDMEERQLSPWTRAAEAGTRLLGIILRRTDARPADALMLRAAEELARRLRTAVAYGPVRMATQFAEYAARVYGLYPIGGRIARMNGGYVEWSRLLGQTRYHFELIEPGWLEGFPHGRVTVRCSGTYAVVRTVSLTARTSRKTIDRFVSSL